MSFSKSRSCLVVILFPIHRLDCRPLIWEDFILMMYHSNQHHHWWFTIVINTHRLLAPIWEDKTEGPFPAVVVFPSQDFLQFFLSWSLFIRCFKYLVIVDVIPHCLQEEHSSDRCVVVVTGQQLLRCHICDQPFLVVAPSFLPRRFYLEGHCLG